MGVRYAELPDDDFCVDTLLVDVAEHFGDPSDRAARGRWPTRNLHDHHLAGFGLGRLSRWDVHIGQNPAIERLHEPEIGIIAIEAADNGRAAAFDAHEHAVAVHRFLDVAGGDVHVGRRFAGLIGDDESKTAGMCFKAADDEVHLVGKTDAAAFGFNELARGNKRFQQPTEGRSLFLRDAKRVQ